MTGNHELDAPPWLRVESTIMATARAIRQAYDARFTELGLNLSEASLLAYVEEFGPQPQSRLAERLGLGRAATGSIVDVLETRACVEREPDPGDRRVWLVTLTSSGKELVDEISGIDQILRRELRAGISRDERHQLADLLVRLGGNLADVLANEDGSD
jgi:MarR family transcriptional regulator for hemolysin